MKSLHTVYFSNFTGKISKIVEVSLRTEIYFVCFCFEQDSTVSALICLRR